MIFFEQLQRIQGGRPARESQIFGPPWRRSHLSIGDPASPTASDNAPGRIASAASWLSIEVSKVSKQT